jgi:hypothetical protein
MNIFIQHLICDSVLPQNVIVDSSTGNSRSSEEPKQPRTGVRRTSNTPKKTINTGIRSSYPPRNAPTGFLAGNGVPAFLRLWDVEKPQADTDANLGAPERNREIAFLCAIMFDHEPGELWLQLARSMLLDSIIEKENIIFSHFNQEMKLGA